MWAITALCLMLSLASLVPIAEGQPSASTETKSPSDQVVQALCGKRVVLLGENPIHGFADTLNFKAQIVHRLVDECHFNALYFEAGTYDFIHLERVRSSGQAVTDKMISAGIGGLWANDETQALVPFLTEKVKMGSLMLGGLDDQLGAGTWPSREMSVDLVQPLQAEEKARCTAILQRHMLWQYTEEAPYGPADKQKILGCLKTIQVKLESSEAQNTDAARQSLEMVRSLQRNFERNFTEDDFTKKDQVLKLTNDRDHSMYMNYTWLQNRLPANSKIVVWAATVHTAKELGGIADFEERVPLGPYLQKDEGNKAFSLGFSAYSGEYSCTHQPVKRLSDAPASSIETKVFAKNESNTVYLSSEQPKRFGPSPACILGTGFDTGQWNKILDGLIIFRQEHDPTWIKRRTQ